MVDQDERYSSRGVSSQKTEVHRAIAHRDKGLYPKALAQIWPDLLAGDDAWCSVMHADTAGTKTSLAYLHWRESGDLYVWRNIAQDAIVMNIDDMLCVGCMHPIFISSTIGRNAHCIPGEIITALIQGADEVIAEINRLGLVLQLTGGETADVGDIVRTIDVGYTAVTRLRRNEVIEIRPRAGDVIVGLRADGQAIYEKTYNSGIGSNGLTSARHDVLSGYYKNIYPEAYAPETSDQYLFTGDYRLTDNYHHQGRDYPIHQLLLSPTRTHAPVLLELMKRHHSQLHGIVHNTGGGQTKVLKFVDDVSIVKDNLFELPPVFQLIKEQSGASWHELYQVFNMGHRMEIYTDENTAQTIIDLAAAYHIEAKVVGQVIDRDRFGMRLTVANGEVVEYD